MNRFFDYILGFIDDIYTSSERVVERAKTCVKYIFYIYAFYAAKVIVEFESLADTPGINFDPSWVLFWANNMTFAQATRILQIIAVVSGICALLLYRRQLARVFIFLSFIQIHGLMSSFSSPNHELYTFLFALFFLAFLPNVWKDKQQEKEKKFLLYIWGAQAFVLLTYTMVGLNKIISSIQQWSAGEIGFLSYKGMSTMIAFKIAEFDSYAPLSSLVTENYWIGWIGAIFSVYILLFAFIAAFRPRIHKVWGFLLIAYHVATFLTLGLWFIIFLLVDIFLIFNSPFYDPKTSWKEVLRDMPIVGVFVRG